MNAHDKLSVPSIRGKPLQFETDISSDEQDDVFQSPPFGASHCNNTSRLQYPSPV